MSRERYDIAVLGGGILGCSTALNLARGRMRVLVLERDGLCMAASSRNAGTLAVQYPRAELTPYTMRALEMWRTAGAWLGSDIGYREVGGLVLAFTPEEAARLEMVAGGRRAAGAPLELVGPNRARELEPMLNSSITLASHCPIDGYADSTITARAYRRALVAENVDLSEGHPVDRIEREAAGFRLFSGSATFLATRVVLAAGVWNADLGRMLGLELPVGRRINQMVVTERMPIVVRRMLGVVSGRLSLKQKSNGTVLVGGGWTGLDGPRPGSFRVDPANLVGNLRLAAHAVPALRSARVVRTWFGVRDHYPDYMPTIGPLAPADDAFIIACGVSGYTLGPYLGRLLAERILGHTPEMPLFDPRRWLTGRATAAAT